MLDTVIANAVQVIVGAKQGHIRLVDGEFFDWRLIATKARKYSQF